MTDRELQKLNRRELLQLLLDQAKETDRLNKLLKETEEQLGRMEEGYERLRKRLDQKDVQIHELRDSLQAEREKREAEREKREIDLSEVGSIAEAALRLNGIFEAAQRAADQYMQSVKEFYVLPESVESQFQQQAPFEANPQPEAPLKYDSPSDSVFVSPEPKSAPSEPLPRRPAAEHHTLERAGSSGSSLPFWVKKKKNNDKTTRLFGWQHN